MFLKKIKSFFSYRSLALCLVFFISFSIFCFGFGTKKTVKANPLIGVFENEFAPIVVNILSSFGIVISIPTAQDFLKQEKDYQYNLQMEFQKKIDEKIEARKALAQMGIQALEKGYLVSKEFVKDILAKWEDYSSKNNLESSSQADSLSITFPNVYKFYDNDYIHSSTIDSYYTNCLKSFAPYVPSDIEGFEIWLSYGGSFGTSPWARVSRASHPDYFGTNITFAYEDGSLMVCGKPYLIRLFKNFDGVKIKFGDYVTKPKLNKKVIDNTLDPVNSFNQGMVISPENVEAVGKVLDPTIPDVSGSDVVNTAPISSVASTVPKIVNGSDVGALPWEMGGQLDKPVDGADSKPVDKPTDGTDSKPFDGILGFLQSILDILKQILAWLEGFFEAFLEFLKKLLVPREGYFVDTFNHFRNDLEGKFGFDTSPLKDLSSNSSVVTPQFIYHFVVLGVPVVLDFSFIVKVVPYCHIIFGGLTAIFLCWYNLRNILLMIRGTSYIEGSNNTGQSEGGK